MSSDEEDLIRYGREFIGVLKDSGMAYEIKKLFLKEGIFTIRVTILGPNFCILEDLILGEVDIFIKERRS